MKGRGDALLKRIALLAGEGDESEELVHFLGRNRPAERAAGEVGENPARAGVDVPSRSVSADEDPAKALRRSRGHLVKRAADIDRLVPVVDSRFDAVCLDLGAKLTQRLDIFF